MKVELTYYKGGKTWKKAFHANNVTDAKKIGEARKPTIKIITANPVF